MRLAPLLLLLALPASAQIRSAPPYDGTSPGHPADEPGPELGANADDAFALLRRGDRDAARLSAARCLRSYRDDEACRLVIEAVEAGVEAPAVPPTGTGWPRAERHFRAGADYYFHNELAEARREWAACRRLDPGHAFCALGLRLAPRSEDGASPAPRRPGAARRGRVAVPGDVRDARQAYLAGFIYFQKGDYESARLQWRACLSAPPAGDAHEDCRAGLERLERLFAP